MRVADNSSWRIFSDFLVDLRMPMFAFIAGAVYALRPLTIAGLGKFIDGKFHRLVLPGVIASLIFWVLGNTLVDGSFASGRKLLETVLLSTGHFWFLQAILLIFLIVGSIDALLRYRAGMLLFTVSIALSLSWKQLSVPVIPNLEIRNTVYLAPYFILGLLIVRSHDWLSQRKPQALIAAACLFCLGLYLNVGVFLETGRLSGDRLDLQSLAMGGGSIVLIYMLFPKISWLDQFGIHTFTIYLYHPLGTSAAKRFVGAAGLDSSLGIFVIGMAAGLAVPYLIHLATSRQKASARFVLGLRQRPALAG